MRHELITFGIACQRFGIDIMAVREIRAWSPVTRLPRVPDYVAGVVNLRGAVLPVIDLAARLGWTATEATPRNPIIVIEHEGQLRGLIVHDVADIVSIAGAPCNSPMRWGMRRSTTSSKALLRWGMTW
jgi:purine-binding chemotaxis protein CheW